MASKLRQCSPDPGDRRATEAARAAFGSAVALAKSGGSAARQRQVLTQYADYLNELGGSTAAIDTYREALG